MSDLRQGGARPADAAALARELVDALAAIATPPPGAASAAPSTAGTAVDVSLAGPRQILENASRFVAPHLPAEARFRGAKALVLRALRIVTRDQTVFNSAIAESLRSALVETEALIAREARRGAEQAAALREFERVAADVPALADRLDRDARRLEERIGAEAQALAGEIAKQAAAREAVGTELLASERRIDALEKAVDAREKRTEALEAHAREAARLVEDVRLMRLELSTLRSAAAAAPAPSGTATAPAAREAAPSSAAHAGVYAQFEETFRGSEEEIRERQRRDVALFASARGTVADLGCGRGEFLEALAQAGIAAAGCDSNPVMVARARQKGLAVDEADLFAWLEARADGSLGGAAAYQVVEHLPANLLLPLVELLARKLAPGAPLLLETVNPESVYAMRWFWMDLTHVRPVPAPSLAQLLRAVGFSDVAVDFRSPVPAQDALPPGADPALEPVARLLFAPQDYAVTGRR